MSLLTDNTQMRYDEIEGYPDRGIERNLPPLGIDPLTATFTETLLPVEQIGWYTRPAHAEKCGDRVHEVALAFKRGDQVPPIIAVATRPGFYTVPDGYHRLHAARLLGLSHIRAYVVAGDGAQK